MYCPKCAAQAVPNQRFCRSCGTNLGVILDAIEGKQPGPIDFEALKNNLRELGANLRAGFEQASAQIKNTKRLDQTPPAPVNQAVNFPPPQVVLADLARDLKQSVKVEISKGLGKVRMANSRKYSLQQAMLSIFGGSAWMVAWFYILNSVQSSGLIASIEQVIFEQTGNQIHGLEGLVRLLWLLGLINVARGMAHLVNGIFFVPKEEVPEPKETVSQTPEYFYAAPYGTPISSVSPASHIASTATNDLAEKVAVQAQPSVTEDATLRFGDAK